MGAIAEIFKDVLESSGFALQRVPRTKDLSPSQRRLTRGRLIEFVGPSAIGKSTVFQKIKPQLKDDWLFEYHTRLPETNLECENDFLKVLRKVYVARIDRLCASGIDLTQNVSIVKRLCEVVNCSILAMTHDFPRGFVFDEGLAHFFAEQIIALDDEAAAEILKRMSLVFILPTKTDTLVERRLLRHTSENVDTVRTQAEKELQIYWSLVAICTRCGIDHIVLNAENSVQENAALAQTFIMNKGQSHSAYPAD